MSKFSPWKTALPRDALAPTQEECPTQAWQDYWWSLMLNASCGLPFTYAATS
jgi:hypothetical protein